MTRNPRVALTCCLLALAAGPGAALGQDDNVVTPQAELAGAEFLPWAPMPSSVGAVCLVDSGVDVTPDTRAVVERGALDGGSGADFAASKHGTVMAQLMGGAVNGWGSVGMWPAARIVSVRASGRGRIEFDDYLARDGLVQ